MLKRRMWIVLTVLLPFIFGCTPLESKTTYQGQLTDAAGNPVADGSYQMTFRLYDEDDAAVGEALWSEMQSVSLRDGLFNVALGDVTPIPTDLFAQKLWLGVEVESDGEMAPRRPLTGAPYAMSLVAGAAVQGTVNVADPLPAALNVANFGDGYGLAVNTVGEAGLAVDGAFSGVPTGEHGLLIDNVIHGAVITSTDGTGLWVNGNGGGADDYYGVRAESEIGDGVFGWSFGTSDTDVGVTGRGTDGYGVYAFSDNNMYGFYTTDSLFVGGSCTGCSSSLIAINDSATILRLGDTVSVSGVELLPGMTTPAMAVGPTAVGESVLGVVVGGVEVYYVAEGVADQQPGIHFGKVGGDAAPGDYLIIVVQGPAQVRAADPAIRSGDVVYSVNSGVGTRAAGQTIGLALDAPDEDGLVWVLIGFD